MTPRDLYRSDVDRHLWTWDPGPERKARGAQIPGRRESSDKAPDERSARPGLSFTAAGQITVVLLDDYDPRWARALAERVGERLPLRVETIELDRDPTLGRHGPRGRRDATRVLAEVVRRLGDPGCRVLAITDRDLVVPGLSFVFGEAQLNGLAAIVSTCRLKPEFYGLPADPRRLFERTLKEALHELGHTYGLLHCTSPSCVMSASADVAEVDMKEARFCLECTAVLVECEPAEVGLAV